MVHRHHLLCILIPLPIQRPLHREPVPSPFPPKRRRLDLVPHRLHRRRRRLASSFTVVPAIARLQRPELGLFVRKLVRRRASSPAVLAVLAREAEARPRDRDGESTTQGRGEGFKDDGAEEGEVAADDADVAFDVDPYCGGGDIPYFFF